jgi:hypothetical protein
MVMPHNKALQLTVSPIRGLSTAELGRSTIFPDKLNKIHPS